MFVALDRLLEGRKAAITKPPTSATAGNGGTGGSGNKSSKNLQKQRSVEQQQKQTTFKFGDRVMAFDNDGGTVHGTVKWTGGSIGSVGKLIGIETVSALICMKYLYVCNQMLFVISLYSQELDCIKCALLETSI